jgi:hypothetical protein
VHKEFVPEEKTVNAEFYKRVLDGLPKSIQRFRPAVFCSRDFFLLHDNAPAHKAASVCQFFTQKSYNSLSHPYSPDLPPPDYFLFPKLKMKLKGLNFADGAEIQEAVTDELKKVRKKKFSAAFQKLYDRAKACIYTDGACFELKNKRCLPHVSSIKKTSPITFGPYCVHIYGASSPTPKAFKTRYNVEYKHPCLMRDSIPRLQRQVSLKSRLQFKFRAV